MENVQRLLGAGDLTGARAACQRLIRAAPRDVDAQSLMALILMNLGEMQGAAYFAARAVDLAPADARRRVNLARLLALDGRHGDALRQLDEASRLAPLDPEPHLVAALTLAEGMRYREAAARCAAGLLADPCNRGLAATRAMALLNIARADEAFAILDSLAQSDPQDAYVLGCRAQVSNYVHGLSGKRVFEVHQAAGAAIERGRPTPVRPRRSKPAGEKLTIAFLTPDLRRHSVASFMIPLLRCLDRSRCEVWVYYTNRVADEVTARCKALCERWIDCGNIADEHLATRIGGEVPHLPQPPDVLVELSGHTSGHSLHAVAMCPAPVIVTYLGYPNTTGLKSVDARLVDGVSDPEASLATEQLVRLPGCFLCFEPPDCEIPVRPRPERPVTFGSFNAVSKINDATVRLWSRLLKRVPEGRLVLKALHLADSGLRDDLRNRFSEAGVETSRLELLHPPSSPQEHLARYNDIDIALDTFPYAGTTTTFEALWMGVPVVTLVGETHASRVGSSILTALDERGLIAESDDDYLDVATGLAADPARLRAYHATLRGRLGKSILMDGPKFAGEFLRAVLAICDTVRP